MTRGAIPAVSDEDADRRLRGFMGYRLKRAYHRIQTETQRTLEGFGLRISTYSALAVICDTPGLRQSRLAGVLGIERSNTVVLIDELEQAGLIRRRRVPSDRRSYALRPTKMGHELCEAATAALARCEGDLMSDIPLAEIEGLSCLLRRIETAPPAGKG